MKRDKAIRVLVSEEEHRAVLVASAQRGVKIGPVARKLLMAWVAAPEYTATPAPLPEDVAAVERYIDEELVPELEGKLWVTAAEADGLRKLAESLRYALAVVEARVEEVEGGR